MVNDASRAAGDTRSRAPKKKRKPVRRAQHWIGQTPRMAVKLLAILVAIVALGLMFSALQTIGSAPLRVGLSLLIISGMLLMCYSEGLTKGANDASISRMCERLQKEGHAISEENDRGCFHPMKGVLAAALVFVVPLVLAVYISLTATPYTYALQDLPGWLTQTYGVRSDVMAPLAAYGQSSGITAHEIVRMLVRLPSMMYVNLFSDPLTMIQPIDRLTPLFVLTYPMCYIIGYLRGPAAHDKRQAMQRKAKKLAVRKVQKQSMVEELVGKGGEVHYGHKAQQEQHKKKELI